MKHKIAISLCFTAMLLTMLVSLYKLAGLIMAASPLMAYVKVGVITLAIVACLILILLWVERRLGGRLS